VDGVGTVGTRWRDDGGAGSLGTLTRVARESIIVSDTVVVELLVLCQVLRGHGMARGKDMSRDIEETDETQEYPYDGDPSNGPSDLMMRVVRIKIRCVGVVDDACKDAEAVQSEESDLHRTSEPRPSGANHDSCERLLVLN